MVVEVYGKEGCGKCDAAKDKLRRMGFEYKEHQLQYHVEHHDGWREDGSIEVLAAHSQHNTMPLLKVKGDFHDYSGAMRTLKKIRKTEAVTA
ncbi:MAG: glutaredoxin domain-containing protein [Planctomycetota bacterium]|jgi:glutaredoxin